MTTWYQWCDIHEDPDQIKRFESAKKAACTPVSLDKDNNTGEFSGSHGKYTCSLEKCNCVDFIRRKLPCKHMYRLAIELGIHNAGGEVKSDAKKIPEPCRVSTKQSYARLEEVVAKLESYPVEVQQEIQNVLYRYRYAECASKNFDSTLLSSPIKDGLLYIDEGCEDYPYTRILPTPYTKSCLSKLYIYLIRKFNDESYFAEYDDSGLKEIFYPHGSNCMLGKDRNGICTFTVSFPDDEITALLNQHGANRCPEYEKKLNSLI